MWYPSIQGDTEISKERYKVFFSMPILLILKNNKLKGFVMPVQHYFNSQPSICFKSHHILVERLSWQHSFTCLQQKICFQFWSIFQCCFIFRFLVATFRLFFVKGLGQLSKPTKSAHSNFSPMNKQKAQLTGLYDSLNGSVHVRVCQQHWKYQ